MEFVVCDVCCVCHSKTLYDVSGAVLYTRKIGRVEFERLINLFLFFVLQWFQVSLP